MPNGAQPAARNELLLNDDKEFLTFVLDGEEYGLDILSVKEIRVWSSVTKIPNTPQYLKGVINLRGVIIPIVDLRERFGLPGQEYDATTVVVVLMALIEGREVMVGIVVDSVSEVYKLGEKEVRESPDFGNGVDSRFITGMATVGDKVIVLLDANKLLDAEDLYSAVQASKAV